MQKRGQVTIFIVIGIIVLVLVVIFMWYQSTSVTKDIEDIAEEQLVDTTQLRPQIKTFVESCLREVAVPGIYLLGVQGGVLYPDDPATVLLTENNLINYGYLNGVNQLSVENMQKEIGRFVGEEINNCLNDFKIFEERGINVKVKSSPKSSARISTSKINILLNLKLDVKKGRDTTTIDKFSTEVDIPLGNVIAKANKIIENHKKSPDNIEFQELTSLDAFINLAPYDESTLIYSIYESDIVLSNAPFIFLFAIRDSNINTAPVLYFIPDVVIKKGETLKYDFFAEDKEADKLTFTSSSSLFPVSTEGKMVVSPTNIDVHSIKITVSDTKGLKDEQTFKITVEP